MKRDAQGAPDVRFRVISQRALGIASMSFLLALTACVADPNDVRQGDRADPQVQLDYIFSVAQETQPARDALTVRCMRDAGFDVPYARLLPPSDRFNVSGLAGLSSPRLDRQFGYASTISGTSTSDALDAFAESLEPSKRQDYADALLGPVADQILTAELQNGGSLSFPSEGCLAEADVALYGDLETSISVTVLMNDVLFLAEHPKVTKVIGDAMADYNQCMRGAGYELQGASASSHAVELYGQYKPVGGSPSQKEITLLRADQACQLEAEMHRRSSDAFYSANEAWILSQAPAISVLASASKRAEQNAHEVTSQTAVTDGVN